MMTTESCHFDNFRAKHDMGQTETATNQTTVTKQFSHLIWRGVSRDIKIFRLFAQQKIAYASANQPCLVSGLIEPVHYLQGIFTDIFAGDRVLLSRDYRHMWTGDGELGLALLAA